MHPAAVCRCSIEANMFAAPASGAFNKEGPQFTTGFIYLP
jgi:hypothetical protein